MNARELVAKLQALIDRENAGDLPVVTEGCDCYGNANDAVIEQKDPVEGRKCPVVVITRPPPYLIGED